MPPPVFEPASGGGDDPFFPLDMQLVDFQEDTGEPATEEMVESGLFGGTAEETCDQERLIEFLLGSPDKAEAWASVQGITVGELPSYIRGLDVRVLAEPATVINHGFDEVSGSAYEVETTLDAGTAVLVDENGDIRTRCYCGNPIRTQKECMTCLSRNTAFVGPACGGERNFGAICGVAKK